MIYDIIVIGAGPAGSTFARETAKSKKKILVIDNEDKSNQKPCGGLLAPDAQKELAHYDLVLPSNVLVSPQIFSVKTIDLNFKLIRHYQRYYLNMDRYLFDKYLVSLIPNNVNIVNGRCIDVVKDNDLFTVTVSCKNKVKKYKSKFIIGADGCSSIVRKKFFKDNTMKYIAIQEWYKCNDKSNSFYSCIFDRKTSSSCSWLIHKNEYLIYGGAFDIKNAKENFEIQKSKLSKFLNLNISNVYKKEACLVYRPRHFFDFVTGKNGAYLIGEAAGFISPSSFEGISSAFKSGSILADIFNKTNDDKKIKRFYKKKTCVLKIKLMFKVLKRWFMYTPFTRFIIMKLNIMSIKMKNK
ncbi:MAG: FAD-binding protein [Bacilli bacterium]|nr:FAD-binding protein [Bacilli bacterium]